MIAGTVDVTRATRVYVPAEGMPTVFESDACERCGEEIQAPNAFRVAREDVDKLVRLGAQVVAALPPEIWADEEAGDTYCDGCGR